MQDAVILCEGYADAWKKGGQEEVLAPLEATPPAAEKPASQGDQQQKGSQKKTKTPDKGEGGDQTPVTLAQLKDLLKSWQQPKNKGKSGPQQKKEIPPDLICFRCGKAGHKYYNCQLQSAR